MVDNAVRGLLVFFSELCDGLGRGLLDGLFGLVQQLVQLELLVVLRVYLILSARSVGSPGSLRAAGTRSSSAAS